jgi:hypothetical protein
MTDIGLDIVFNKVCVLVTAAFALALIPGFRRSERSLISVRDRGTALLVFMVLGLVEETVVGQSGWFNPRIVAVCAAVLVAGRWARSGFRRCAAVWPEDGCYGGVLGWRNTH